MASRYRTIACLCLWVHGKPMCMCVCVCVYVEYVIIERWEEGERNLFLHCEYVSQLMTALHTTVLDSNATLTRHAHASASDSRSPAYGMSYGMAKHVLHGFCMFMHISDLRLACVRSCVRPVHMSVRFLHVQSCACMVCVCMCPQVAPGQCCVPTAAHRTHTHRV